MERLTRISQKVKEMGWDALLIGQPENLFYTTSFGGEDSWLIVLADGTSALLTDGRFWEEAQNIKQLRSLLPKTRPWFIGFGSRHLPGKRNYKVSL